MRGGQAQRLPLGCGDKGTPGRLSTALAPTPSPGLRVGWRAGGCVGCGVRGRVQTGEAVASRESRCSGPSPLHMPWGYRPQMPQPPPFSERGKGGRVGGYQLRQTISQWVPWGRVQTRRASEGPYSAPSGHPRHSNTDHDGCEGLHVSPPFHILTPEPQRLTGKQGRADVIS